MSSKLGLILSLTFAIQVLCFMGDLTCLQTVIGNMEACSIAVGRQIGKEGYLSRQIMGWAKETYGFTVTPITRTTPQVGSLFEYRVYFDYVPISFLEPFPVSMVRSTVIGYIE